MTYVLILFAHVGLMGEGNSNSLTTVTFGSKTACTTALTAAVSMSSGSTKVIKGVCVSQN